MILTIGAFDGFHRGHARLLERARALSESLETGWGAVTFYPHPGVFMKAIDLTLFTLQERELIRRVLDIPHLFIIDFDERLQSLSPEDFWRKLERTFEVSGIVVGDDFRFGRGQAGNCADLLDFCRRDGLPAETVSLLEHDGTKFSSTEIRKHVMMGEVRQAWDVLGYPWFLWSRVTHGNRRGRTMGFPTANIDVSGRHMLPDSGVYAVAVPVDENWSCGALSIGNNPTFGDVSELRVEVFILDFDGDLYGRDFPVFLLDRIRPAIRFPDAEVLKEQIGRDILLCRSIFQEELSKTSRLFSSFLEHFQSMDAEGEFVPAIWKLV